MSLRLGGSPPTQEQGITRALFEERARAREAQQQTDPQLEPEAGPSTAAANEETTGQVEVN